MKYWRRSSAARMAAVLLLALQLVSSTASPQAHVRCARARGATAFCTLPLMHNTRRRHGAQNSRWSVPQGAVQPPTAMHATSARSAACFSCRA